MEKLLHYVWQHRLYPAAALHTDNGLAVEVIDPGLHNHDAGPDFFNAKVRLGDTLWVGNVEIHERSSDWYRHGHDGDAAYDNVVLHVASTTDCEVRTQAGQMVPQLRLEVPPALLDNYQELLAEEHYPPCFRAIPDIPQLTVHSWMNALTVERLEEKTERIESLLQRTGGDWEKVFFVTLARNFGFGINSDAFEEWALTIPLAAAGKHRDDAFQIEAMFFGQAGLLAPTAAKPERQDDYFRRLGQEYAFLAHKFDLRPMDARHWRFLRLRPQNFPHVRLSQFVSLFHRQRVDFSRLLEASGPAQLKALLATQATPYWETHYTFGGESAPQAKTLQEKSLDLMIINTVSPILFAYGRARFDEELAERAFSLLEQTKAEQNHITRSWGKAGIRAENAADSQALIRLRKHYCDRKDCLRCRFGTEYLRRRSRLAAGLQDAP